MSLGVSDMETVAGAIGCRMRAEETVGLAGRQVGLVFREMR